MVSWEKARIPTTEKYNAIKRLEKLFDKYQRLKKNQHRRCESQQEMERVFEMEINGLFDIAHQHALVKIW